MDEHMFRLFTTCSYCQDRIAPEDVTFDHIVPRAMGGAHAIWNLTPACQPCNFTKGDSLGWRTFDGRTGFFWDGRPGHVGSPLPRKPHGRLNDVPPAYVTWWLEPRYADEAAP